MYEMWLSAKVEFSFKVKKKLSKENKSLNVKLHTKVQKLFHNTDFKFNLKLKLYIYTNIFKYI